MIVNNIYYIYYNVRKKFYACNPAIDSYIIVRIDSTMHASCF